MILVTAGNPHRNGFRNAVYSQGLRRSYKKGVYAAAAMEGSSEEIALKPAAVLDAEIRINNPPENILPGYSFSGFIVAGEDEEILTVSQNAIRYKEGKPFVDIIRDKKTEEAEVTVEPYVHGFVKITSGVAEGDKLKDQGEN